MKNYVPNVDLMVPFNSTTMLINDRPEAENGFTFIKAGADGPPIHQHPLQEERFVIVEGELEVFHSGKWHTLKAGESVFIPKKMPHSYRSRSSQDCLFSYELTPKGNFSAMLKNLEHISKNRRLKSTSDIRSLIHLAMVFSKYKKEVRSTKPPAFVMSAMAGLGKLFRYSID